MKHLLGILFLLTTISLTGCGGIKVERAEQQLEVGQYRTVAWRTPALEQESERSSLPLYQIDRKVRKLLGRALEQKGYRWVEPGEVAELQVEYRLSQRLQASKANGTGSPRDQLDQEWSAPDSANPNNTALHNHPVNAVFQQSALQVTLVDTEKRQVVWQTLTTKLVGESNPTEDRLRRLISKLVALSVKELPRAAK